jgi:predicted nucleic acid-binding Zn ribbon protein
MVFRRKKKVKKKRGGGGHIGEHKFCPVCGRKLEKDDTFCTNCGYSFSERFKKTKKKIKWLNVIIILIILIGGYFLIRYTSGQSLFPVSWQDAVSTFVPNR